MIQNSNMTTLSMFANLESVNSGGTDNAVVDGRAYSVVITGLYIS